MGALTSESGLAVEGKPVTLFMSRVWGCDWLTSSRNSVIALGLTVVGSQSIAVPPRPLGKGRARGLDRGHRHAPAIHSKVCDHLTQRARVQCPWTNLPVLKAIADRPSPSHCSIKTSFAHRSLDHLRSGAARKGCCEPVSAMTAQDLQGSSGFL